MKAIIIILISLIHTILYCQVDIKLDEEVVNFKIGSRNAITVTIPFAKKDDVEKNLKRELKDWDGKFDTKDGEFITIQANAKFMGPKPFDAYSKILTSNSDYVKIAMAVDLGGAFMTNREHSTQFKAMSEKLKLFAKETSIKAIEAELEKNQDMFSDLQKSQKNLEKEKKNLEEDIEDYKKKIIDSEEKIKINLQDQENQKKLINIQEQKISEISKKLKSIK